MRGLNWETPKLLLITRPIDERRDIGCSKAIVDVNHAHIGRTGVQHAEQGGESVESGSVADAGGNGDDGNSDEASDNAGQSAFHARADDDDSRLGKHAAMCEQAMDARDSNVVKRLNLVAHELGGNDGFFGDGNVAGSGRDDGDDALVAVISAARRIVAVKRDAASDRAIFGLWHLGRNGMELLLGSPRGENVGVGVMSREAGEDLRHLSGRFALTEDDFGHSLTQGTMMIELGEAEVFEGEVAKAVESFVGGKLTGADLVEQLSE